MIFQGQSPGREYHLGRDRPKMRCWPNTTDHLRIKGESTKLLPPVSWSRSHMVPAKKTLNSLLKYVLLWEFKVMWCRTTLTRQYTLENGWWPSSPFSGRNGSIKINITTQLRLRLMNFFGAFEATSPELFASPVEKENFCQGLCLIIEGHILFFKYGMYQQSDEFVAKKSHQILKKTSS